MTGPKILAEAIPPPYIAPKPTTGIRRTNTEGWAAVKGGRLVDTFEGIGSKAAAIRAAGTNRIID